MNTRSVCFTVAAVGFYLAEILLFANVTSVVGVSLLIMSMLVLLAGVFARSKKTEGRKAWLENCAEPAATTI